MLAANHSGYLDFAFVPARGVRFLAKEELFRIPVLAQVLRWLHYIPVDRSAGHPAYLRAVSEAQAGHLIGVFPEGTISSDCQLLNFKSGAVRIAAEAGVPLIPVAIWGSHRIWTKGSRRQRCGVVRIHVGEPLDPECGTEGLRSTIAAMLAELSSKETA